MPAHLKTQQWPQDWKRSIFIPIPKKGNVKEYSNYRKITLISHRNKGILKILQARPQQYMNSELPEVQAWFRNDREPEIKLPTSFGSSKKQESSRKTSTSALLIMSKPLTVWITTNCGTFWKRWEYQTTWPASWEICMQIKKQQLELDMERQTGSKSGKECIKVAYCHPAYLIYMQSTYIMRYARLDEAQAGTKTAGRNTNNWDDTTLMAESEELKSLLMRVKKLA